MENAALQNFISRNSSIKLWPPSHSTRLVLIDRMVKNLSTESIFSRKYGLFTPEEATYYAKQIEYRCFITANFHFAWEPDGDGSSTVHLYAKESSKLILEVLKKGPKPKEIRELVFDISHGRRAFIEGEEATEILAPLTQQGNSYSKIIFSNRSFGIEAARIAEPILSSIKNQLKEVDISDFIAGRREDEALEVMRIFSSALEGSVLKYLNLSDNALDEKGVRAFGSLLKSQNSLEELYLMNDGISKEAAKALTELIPSTETIRILHFHNNMTGDEGALFIAEILKRSPLLEDFRCSSARIGSEGGIALAKALAGCDRVKKLDLRDNMFGVEAGLALSKTLEKLNDIKELYLSYLNLEDDGAIAILDAVEKYLPAVEVLEMAGNDITFKSVASLASCVSSKQYLKKLNLSENELRDEGAVEIAKALEKGHAELKEVDLSSNMVRRVGARILARAVACNKPKFLLLNINGNAISDEGVDELKEMLKGGLLGPLDENDTEGAGNGEEETEGDEEDDEMEVKLRNLKVDG